MNILSRFKPIRLFALDVDGVLTDGSLLIFDDGLQVRKMNIKDGYALQLAIKKGYRIVVISGADAPAVSERLLKLGVVDVFMKVSNKLQVLDEYRKEHGLDFEQILFMGDDIPDLEVMQRVGLPCSPADAVSEIRDVSAYISPFEGGTGCVRDIIEKVLKLNNHWVADHSVSSR